MPGERMLWQPLRPRGTLSLPMAKPWAEGGQATCPRTPSFRTQVLGLTEDAKWTTGRSGPGPHCFQCPHLKVSGQHPPALVTGQNNPRCWGWSAPAWWWLVSPCLCGWQLNAVHEQACESSKHTYQGSLCLEEERKGIFIPYFIV